mgnify:CR=1 FL=1
MSFRLQTEDMGGLSQISPLEIGTNHVIARGEEDSIMKVSTIMIGAFANELTALHVFL